MDPIENISEKIDSALCRRRQNQKNVYELLVFCKRSGTKSKGACERLLSNLFLCDAKKSSGLRDTVPCNIMSIVYVINAFITYLDRFLA